MCLLLLGVMGLKIGGYFWKIIRISRIELRMRLGNRYFEGLGSDPRHVIMATVYILQALVERVSFFH